MVYILVVAILISALLIILLRGESPLVPYRSDHASTMHRLGERPVSGSRDPSLPSDHPFPAEELRNLTRTALEQFCRALLAQADLHFISIDYDQDHAFHILSRFEKPFLRGNVIVGGFLAAGSGIVDSAEIIGFSDMVKAERAMKGVFVTNGLFSEEVMKLNEGAAVELIDRVQLKHLMKSFAPHLLAGLETRKG